MPNRKVVKPLLISGKRPKVKKYKKPKVVKPPATLKEKREYLIANALNQRVFKVDDLRVHDIHLCALCGNKLSAPFMLGNGYIFIHNALRLDYPGYKMYLCEHEFQCYNHLKGLD